MDKYIEILSKATNIQPLLEHLKSGRVIRNTLSVLYRLVAVLLGLALVMIWFKSWRFMGALNFVGGVAFLIWQISFPYASFLAIKAFYLRAKEVSNYPDSDYVVAPVIAMLIKANGEMIFIFLGVMSVPAILLTWLGGQVITYYFDFLDVGNVFFAGIFAFLWLWAVGFAALIIAQLIAEWTLAIFSIANDVNVLRRSASSTQSAPVSDSGRTG